MMEMIAPLTTSTAVRLRSSHTRSRRHIGFGVLIISLLFIRSATIKRLAVGFADNLLAYRVGKVVGLGVYGITIMPAPVTSLFRSQVFSYFSVAAS
jgi:hypothetical protein